MYRLPSFDRMFPIAYDYAFAACHNALLLYFLWCTLNFAAFYVCLSRSWILSKFLFHMMCAHHAVVAATDNFAYDCMIQFLGRADIFSCIDDAISMMSMLKLVDDAGSMMSMHKIVVVSIITA